MIKELILILGLVLSLTVSVNAAASAELKNKRVTPYGDFCERVSHYGMHKHMLTPKEAEDALTHYYSNKGLDVQIIKSEGRFIKAVIKNKETIVDTIIFDRHTGRIRSIY